MLPLILALALAAPGGASAAGADAQALLNRGWGEFRLGQSTAALTDLAHARALAPDSFEANLALATAYATLGRYEAGLAFYRRASALEPEDGDAYRGLGACYAYLGRHAEAARAYEKAAERLPAGATREDAKRFAQSQAALAGPPETRVFSPPDGFSRSAQRVLEKSRERARSRGEAQVSLADLAFELCSEFKEGDASFVFDELALDPARFARGIEAAVPAREGALAPGGLVAFSPGATRAMRLALDASRRYPASRGRKPSATSLHLFFGVVGAADGALRRFFEERDVTQGTVAGLLVKHYAPQELPVIRVER